MNQLSKVAIVHDDFIQHGGAEKIAEALIELFPSAHIYSSVISKEWKDKLLKKFPGIVLHQSFLGRLPFSTKFYKALVLFYPFVFSRFKLDGFDLILSSTSRFAHGVRKPKHSVHISYVHSPARMIWEPESYFDTFAMVLLYPFLLLLRIIDKRAARMPDILIANSKTTLNRIKNYWGRDARVINPFHNLGVFKKNGTSSDYYIVVSRIEKWKQIDIAIEAFSKLKKRLVVVGKGKYLHKLRELADPEYVEFCGRLSEVELILKYLGAKALIMTQKEDFGIASIEAQSLGVPVIAYKEGGASESIIHKKTGFLFENQNKDSLIEAIEKFEEIAIDPQMCIINANKFSKDIFVSKILDIIEEHGHKSPVNKR